MQTCSSKALNSVGSIHILIVGQSKAVDLAIATKLRRQGYQVDTISSEQLKLLTPCKTRPDLIIVDRRDSCLMSLDIYQHLRRLSQVPIILLASDCELNVASTRFESGADDCISCPFGMEELLTRIRVRLRYIRKEKPSVLQVDKLTINFQERKAYWSDQEIKLTSKELDLLKYLMIHYQQVIPRYQLIEHLWGNEYDVSSNVVEAYVCRLRLKLEQYSRKRLIQTVYRVGYKLCSP